MADLSSDFAGVSVDLGEAVEVDFDCGTGGFGVLCSKLMIKDPTVPDPKISNQRGIRVTAL